MGEPAADTGTSFHVAPSAEGAIPGTVRKVQPKTAQTVCGTGIMDTVGEFHFPSLGCNIQMFIVPESPLFLISTHQLWKDEGIKLDTYTDPDHPAFVLRCGKRVPLRIDNNVPYLQSNIYGTVGFMEKIINIEELTKQEENIPIEVKNGFILLLKEYNAVSSGDDDNDVEEARCNPRPMAYNIAKVEEHMAIKISKSERAKHNLTHYPKATWCRSCCLGNKRRMRRRVPEMRKRKRSTEWGELITLDAVQASIKSVRGYCYRQHILDEGTGMVSVMMFKKRPKAADTTYHYKTFMRGKPDLPKESRHHMDNGGEHMGVFKVYLEQKAVNITYGLPHKPTTDHLIERLNGESNRFIRAALLQANLPITFWCFAARLWERVHNEWSVKDGETPYMKLWKEEKHMRLRRLPFGCGGVYRRETSAKEEETARECIFLGYQRGGYLIADVVDYISNRELRLINSDDVTWDEHFFPGKTHNIMRKIEDIDFRNIDETEEIMTDIVEGKEEDYGFTDNTNDDYEGEDIPVQAYRNFWDSDIGLSDNPEEEMIKSSSQELNRGTVQTDDAAPQEEIPLESDGNEHPNQVIAREPQPQSTKQLELSNDANREETIIQVSEKGRPIRIKKSRKIYDPGGEGWSFGCKESKSETISIIVRPEGKPMKQVWIGEKDFLKLMREVEKDDGREMASKVWEHAKELELQAGSIGTTLIIPFSKAQSIERGRKAIVREYTSQKQEDSLDRKLMAMSEVKATRPEARFARTFTHCCIKGVELPEELQKYKARFLIIGNKIYGNRGQLVKETNKVWEKPVGLQVSRLMQIKAVENKEAGGITADMDVAYLQAYFSGMELWAEIDPKVIGDDEFREAMGFDIDAKHIVRPVARVMKSIYGTDRGAYDLGQKVREEMKAENWIEDKDIETNLYLKDIVIKGKLRRICTMFYVDDARFAGHLPTVQREYRSVAEKLRFKGSSSSMERFLGVRTREIVCEDKHKRAYVSDQTDYILMMVKQYRTRSGFEGEFPTRQEPITVKRMKDITQEDLKPGKMTAFALTSIGEMLWCVRNTRPDLAEACNILSVHGTKWSKLADDYLFQIISYMYYNAEKGLMSIVDERDEGQYYLKAYTDSDFGGCTLTGRSTTGYCVFIEGKQGTRVLVDWAAKRQSMCANSSAEAEITALNYAMNVAIIPVIIQAEVIFNQRMTASVNTDNTAIEKAIEAGFSVKLRYIKKTQRVSLARLHEIFYPDQDNKANPQKDESDLYMRLERVATKSNIADIFTKDLHGREFIKHQEGLQLVSLGKVVFKSNSSEQAMMNS
jgi:hypothetical protein